MLGPEEPMPKPGGQGYPPLMRRATGKGVGEDQRAILVFTDRERPGTNAELSYRSRRKIGDASCPSLRCRDYN